jgi:hypothetical protein
MHPSPLEIAAAKAVPHSEYAWDSDIKSSSVTQGMPADVSASEVKDFTMQEEPDNQLCWLGIAGQKEGGILQFFRKFRR